MRPANHAAIRRACSPLFAIALITSVAFTQTAAAQPALAIAGVQATEQTLTLDALRQLPVRRVRVQLENGTPAEYEGVAIADILGKAGLVMGTAIRGKRLAEYLLVTSRDGYRVAFSLPELDPLFNEREVLLCFTRNGATLGADEGPFRLVIPSEKRHARWARQVERMTLKKEL